MTSVRMRIDEFFDEHWYSLLTKRNQMRVSKITTNVAFGEGEKELYVTVVKDPKDSQAKGSIVKISNVK